MRARGSVLYAVSLCRGSSDSLPWLFYTLPHILLLLPEAWHLAVPVSGQGHSLVACTRAGKCQWHVLGKVGVCFSHPLPRTCCGAASTWTLPLAHADPELTLLPKSLEISAFFMATMRPSIISEGATMWQPAGKEQRC